MKINRVLFLVILLSAILFAEEDKSNKEYIENNVLFLLDSIGIDKLLIPGKFSIGFGSVSNEKKGFLKSIIYNFSKDRNKNISSGDSVTFLIEQFQTDIVYLQKTEGFLGLNSTTIRQNKIHLAGWIEDSNEKLLQAISTDKIFADTLKSDNVAELENSPYSFTKGKTQELSIWTEVVEPVFVLSSLSVIIYLFFSVRS